MEGEPLIVEDTESDLKKAAQRKLEFSKNLPLRDEVYKRKVTKHVIFPSGTSKITKITFNTIGMPTICYQIYDEGGIFRTMQYSFSAESFWDNHEKNEKS
jgi:hypothetical protein